MDDRFKEDQLMSHIEWMLTLQEMERLLFLAVPGLVAIGFLLLTRPSPQIAMTAMIAFLWQLPALLALHLLAQAFQWWRFLTTGATLDGLPDRHLDRLGDLVGANRRPPALPAEGLAAGRPYRRRGSGCHASGIDPRPLSFLADRREHRVGFLPAPGPARPELTRSDIKPVLRAIFRRLRIWLTIGSGIFQVSSTSRKPTADKPAFPCR
jgi:hypothetical protein